MLTIKYQTAFKKDFKMLVYEVIEEELLLYLMRTGTHSDIF